MEASKDFRRERIDDIGVRSICRKCGEVLVGDIGKAMFYSEWEHAERCDGRQPRSMIFTSTKRKSPTM